VTKVFVFFISGRLRSWVMPSQVLQFSIRGFMDLNTAQSGAKTIGRILDSVGVRTLVGTSFSRKE
jgi:hypothetical protein